MGAASLLHCVACNPCTTIFPMDAAQLHESHTKHAIAERLEASVSHSYFGDFVLGAVDGTVTTFAIVAGVAGAEFSTTVALILGIANVIADGFSMAASNFLKARSELQLLERFRRMEEMHIDEVPEAEREEIRQIFAGKGFDGRILEEVVGVITRDRRRWVDTMLTEEWGLRLDMPNPTKAAGTTFLGFVAAGLVPLFPLFAAGWLSSDHTFAWSAILAGVTFFIIGLLRGYVLHVTKWYSAVETLFVGGAAAGIAYLVGVGLKSLIS